MSVVKYGSIWCIDHCLPIASFSILDENEIEKCFNWINLRPMYSGEKIMNEKSIYNHYLEERSDIIKNTQFKVDDVFGDISIEDSIPAEQ